MAYASIEDIQARMTRTLTERETEVCSYLLDDIAVLIDGYNENAAENAKKLVSCRAVVRMLGDGTDMGIPIGASQGSMSGMGYAQSWSIGSGASGELYLAKAEKDLLGGREKTGFSHSPVESLVPEVES